MKDPVKGPQSGGKDGVVVGGVYKKSLWMILHFNYLC